MSYLTKTLLYVSDIKFMHLIVKDTLKAHNVTVTSVYSGEEALKALKVSKPDLILSDTVMSGMSGFELCEYVRDHYDIPLVIYSASEALEDIERAFEAGAKGYIVKKYHNEVLAEKIMKYVK